MKNTSKRYSPEVQERAMRLVSDHKAEYSSLWSAVGSFADKIGCTNETLRCWGRRTEGDEGQAPWRNH
jgi:hypothetical protein